MNDWSVLTLLVNFPSASTHSRPKTQGAQIDMLSGGPAANCMLSTFTCTNANAYQPGSLAVL
eukprot:4335257-Amphidinium_carterae.2